METGYWWFLAVALGLAAISLLFTAIYLWPDIRARYSSRALSEVLAEVQRRLDRGEEISDQDISNLMLQTSLARYVKDLPFQLVVRSILEAVARQREAKRG